MTEPKLKIVDDDTLLMIHEDGTTYPINDPDWIRGLRRAVAKGEALPMLIRDAEVSE